MLICFPLCNKEKSTHRSLSPTEKIWTFAPETLFASGRKFRKRTQSLQAFEGLVIAVKHGKEAGGTFTVRRIASGVGVEKIFPLYSPMIDSIETIKRSKVRRAKLYHIRDKAAKEIRRQMRNIREVKDVEGEPEVESEKTVEAKAE